MICLGFYGDLTETLACGRRKRSIYLEQPWFWKRRILNVFNVFSLFAFHLGKGPEPYFNDFEYLSPNG